MARRRVWPATSHGYGVTQPTRPAPMVRRQDTGHCLPENAWCANCYRNGHPAYACPQPHKQVWPAPWDWTPKEPLLPPARVPPPEPASLDVEVTWDEMQCDCDYCHGLRVALRLYKR